MRAVALALVIGLLPRAAMADPAVTAEEPAPESYRKVPWRWSGTDTVGYWYSAAQVERLDARIAYLERSAAKTCVDAQVSADGSRWPLWVGVAVGLLVGGGAVWAVRR